MEFDLNNVYIILPLPLMVWALTCVLYSREERHKTLRAPTSSSYQSWHTSPQLSQPFLSGRRDFLHHKGETKVVIQSKPHQARDNFYQLLEKSKMRCFPTSTSMKEKWGMMGDFLTWCRRTPVTTVTTSSRFTSAGDACSCHSAGHVWTSLQVDAKWAAVPVLWDPAWRGGGRQGCDQSCHRAQLAGGKLTTSPIIRSENFSFTF